MLRALACLAAATALLVPANIGAQRVRPINGEVAADGYVFRVKAFTSLNLHLEVHEYPTREAIRAEYAREGMSPPAGLLAFSTWGDTGCVMHILDPAVAYEPEIIGHELSHCLHGNFHPGQEAAR